MLNPAGLILMIGVGQAIFQTYLLAQNGYWSHFTIGDLLADFGLAPGYIPVLWMERTVEWLLERELSITMIAVGGAFALWPPLCRLFDGYHAARLRRQLRRETSN